MGKSEDLGPKTSVLRDLRKNKMGKWLNLISRVMRDSHVEFKKKKKGGFSILNSSSFPN